MSDLLFTSITFRNFKAFRQYALSFQSFNVMVGENNSGKSTIIIAFRALEIALRKARARKADRVPGPDGLNWGWNITSVDLPITLENVHSDYEEADSTIDFRVSNGAHLYLHFPQDGGCFLLAEYEGEHLRTPRRVNSTLPLDIGVVPVLGPVEHEEALVREETVRTGLPTHRASRHFRNYWRYNSDEFDQFSALIESTWPGMTIEPPEVVDFMNQKLAMFCSEDRIARELYWAGFGFQVWCQLLTHIIRSRNCTIIVVDEPEIYLHPELQRKLIGILRNLGPEILMATHSTEIVGEVDPSDILLIDKSKRSGDRLKDLEAVQDAIDHIGSVHNVALSQLARTRRILFVEGDDDFRRLRRFAAALGLDQLATGLDLTPVESGGFSRWRDIQSFAWGIERTLGTPLKLGAVFDSDYWPPDQIAEMVDRLRGRLEFVRVLERKELENYMLVPDILERTLARWVRDRARRTGVEQPTVRPISELLAEATDPLREEAQAQYVARRLDYVEETMRDAGKDRATRTQEALQWFGSRWEDLESRIEIVPGKKALARLRTSVQDEYSVSLTDTRIIREFRCEEIPADLAELLQHLDHFRSQ